MQRVILSALLTAVLLNLTSSALTEETRVKRSDGLIRDAVNQMVAEQLERKHFCRNSEKWKINLMMSRGN